MDYKVEQYSIFEIGPRVDADGRPLQEDCVYSAPSVGKSSGRVFIVADGMGSTGMGAIAAGLVCGTIGSELTAINDEDFSVASLQHAISVAYDALDRYDLPDGKSMGTTVAILRLYSRGYIAAHMGDSRVYHIRPGHDAKHTKILFASDDHTMARHLVKKGEMTQQEAEKSAQRHVITRAMQPRMQRRCRADVHVSADVAPGDFFVLCTDGLHQTITDDYIREIFSSQGGTVKNKMSLLLKASKSSNDNHSALIVHVTEVIDNVPSSNKKSREMPNTQVDMEKKKIALAAKTITGNVREFVQRQNAGGPSSDQLPISIKFILILMGVLLLIMGAYYLFIRTDETLQPAGTAVEQNLQSEENEVYGYEITEQDIRNEAQPIAPEVYDDAPADDDVYYPEGEPEITADEPSSPAPSDEPILQE